MTGRGLYSVNLPAAPPYTHGPYIWNENVTFDSTVTFSGTLTVSGTLDVTGSINFGDASTDSLLLKGRLSTMTAGGSAITIDATTYQYGEGIELRYNVSDWADTYTLTSFNGMYLRAETNEANASGSLRGMEVYGTANNVGVSGLWGGLFYAYIKGATAKTVATAYGIQSELSWDAGASTTTITTEMASILAKITGGVADNYTKIHGMIVRAGDMDGASRTYGNAIRIEDDSGMAGVITWTTGISISSLCTKGIHLGSSAGAASASGLLMGIGTSNDPSLTATADAMFAEFRTKSTATTGSSRGLYWRHEIAGINSGSAGEALRVFTKLTASCGTVRGAQISLDMSTAGAISGLGAGVDAQILLGNGAYTTGTIASLNTEWYASGSSTTISGVQASFIRAVLGGDGTGLAAIEDSINLISVAGGTNGSGNVVSAVGNEPTWASATHKIRVNMNGTTMYLVAVLA